MAADAHGSGAFPGFFWGSAKHVDAEAGNFVRLVVENRRLSLLTEIVTQFEQLKAEAESRTEASVVSAFALEPAQLKALEQALRRRLGREVQLRAEIDSPPVGGVVIRAGDSVIDGSVKGQLSALASYLSH